MKLTNSYEELKEAKEIYIKYLLASGEKVKRIKYPSLKYMIYSYQLLEAFKDRINQIKSNINEIKEKINDFEGNKIGRIKEIEKLDENMNKLISLEKEAKDGYEYYKTYLIGTARISDDLGDETAKNVYVKSSYDIIKSQIEFYMKCEKYFVIFKDDINIIKNIFNL